MAEVITTCPCGEPHAMSDSAWTAFCAVTTGKPETVNVQTGGRAWQVPRVYIAVHGLKAAELPALAERYGWPETG